MSPFGLKTGQKRAALLFSVVCLTLSGNAWHPPEAKAAAPIRVVTDLKSDACDFPEVAPPKLTALPAVPKMPVALHSERHDSENKYVLTFSVPAKLEDACHGLVLNCQGALGEVGRQAVGAGKWLDNLFRANDLSQRKAPVYISPAVSEAAKYCSRFHVCYTHEGRLKTVAPQ